MLLLVLPAVAAVLLGIAAAVVQRLVPPRIATVLIAGLTALAAVAALGATVLVAFGFVAQYGPWEQWCAAIDPTHDRVPVWMGAPAVVAVMAALIMIRRSSRGWKQSLVRASRADVDLEVLPTRRPLAYAVPGRPGHVVVSAGMLEHLQADERRVLLAHERSHLQRAHHRYLWVVEMATSAVPLLRPLRSQIRYATERWADEDAVGEVGDRRLVARAIVRAALAQTEYPRGEMALAGHGVRERVEALLRQPLRATVLAELLLGSAAALLAALVTSGVQLHHLLAFIAHVCPR